jgi:hypothetical protein
MARGRTRRGFVLLMVLVVLAVAGSLLGLCAHRTSRRALEVGIRERTLQRRWAVRSLEAVCLPQAEAILTEAGPEEGPPPASVRQTLDIGGTTFDLVVADEQAKANVNQVTAIRRTDGVRACAGALSEGRWVLQVVPRPVDVKTSEIRSPKVLYASLEQVFQNTAPEDLLGTRDRPGPAERLTCWGNGKVHFRRSPVAVLRVVLEGVLTEYQLHRLVTLRDEQPDAGLHEILAGMELDDKMREDAETRLTETSTCHSLWITARGKTRQWHRLSVTQQGDAENDAGHWTFVW